MLTNPNCPLCNAPLRKRTVRINSGLSYTESVCCHHFDLVGVEEANERFQIEQEKYFFSSIDDSFVEHSMFERERLDVRMKAIKKIFKSESRIVEVGPGNGHFLVWLKELGHSASAVEHSPVLAEQLSRELKMDVHAGEFETASLENDSYDGVCTFHVIEHVPDAFSHLQTAYRILRKGGYLLIATPNGRSWQHFVPGRLSPNFNSAHLRLFSQKSLTRACESMGFSVVEFASPEYTSAWLRVLSKLYRRITGEDEETTAGKYAGGSSTSRKIFVRTFKFLSSPIRKAQSILGGGNELFLIVKKT